jgi:hypothetical protein
MSLAKAMNVKWVHDGKVYTGGFCTAQGKSDSSHMSLGYHSNICAIGILQQAGDTGSALAILACIDIFPASVR